MKKLILIFGTLFLLLSISLVSCKSSSQLTEKSTTVAIQHNGAQLWGNNCIRCHNSPPPSAYSDNEWTAITNHMQKVAGITVSEADQVLEFLSSAN